MSACVVVLANINKTHLLLKREANISIFRQIK